MPEDARTGSVSRNGRAFDRPSATISSIFDSTTGISIVTASHCRETSYRAAAAVAGPETTAQRYVGFNPNSSSNCRAIHPWGIKCPPGWISGAKGPLSEQLSHSVRSKVGNGTTEIRAPRTHRPHAERRRMGRVPIRSKRKIHYPVFDPVHMARPPRRFRAIFGLADGSGNRQKGRDLIAILADIAPGHRIAKGIAREIDPVRIRPLGATDKTPRFVVADAIQL